MLGVSKGLSVKASWTFLEFVHPSHLAKLFGLGDPACSSKPKSGELLLDSKRIQRIPTPHGRSDPPTSTWCFKLISEVLRHPQCSASLAHLVNSVPISLGGAPAGGSLIAEPLPVSVSTPQTSGFLNRLGELLVHVLLCGLQNPCRKN